MGTIPSASAEPIDRLGPTRRPDDICVMYQRWACLLFLHWEVPAELLRPRIPAGLELDLFEGRAFVGLVPFTMTGVRPRGLPAVRALSDFHEVNVRTYVHRKGFDPGVWFFSLDAASAPAVRLARWSYKLPYAFAAMELNGSPTRGGEAAGPGERRTYRSNRLWGGPLPASCSIRYDAVGSPSAAMPGTLEHFLAERYLLYTEAGGRLYRGQVHHTPYPLQPATVAELDESLVAAAGIERPAVPPLAHYARAVEVEIFPLRRVRDGA